MRHPLAIRNRINALFKSYQGTELIEEECIKHIESWGEYEDSPSYAYWNSRFQKNHEYQTRLNAKMEALRWVLEGE